ncbi:alpha/beta hydrolase [Nocardia sp. NPDC023852]|uniref:alpha/beta fold hydrolase n=1 Tax=Nocardia sp. NPDC023852 TaxID=3154697 RepID=UPI0033DC639E
MWLLALYPHLVRSVATLGSSAEIEYRRPEFDPLIDHLSEHGVAGEIQTEQGPQDVLDTVTYIMFGNWSMTHHKSLITAWQNNFRRLDKTIGDAAFQVVDRPALPERLGGCNVPVLGIAGDDDQAYPADISGEGVAKATGGRHVTVPRGGHSVALEQADLVAPHLEKLFALADQS